MAERTKATVLKTVSGATRSRVRIPVLPQESMRMHDVSGEVIPSGTALTIGPRSSARRRSALFDAAQQAYPSPDGGGEDTGFVVRRASKELRRIDAGARLERGGVHNCAD